jgi:hypothetical protein
LYAEPKPTGEPELREAEMKLRQYSAITMLGLVAGLLGGAAGQVRQAPEAQQEAKWEQKANIPTLRATLSTAEVDGKIYAIGGMNNQVVKPATEMYDPGLDKWEKKADMLTPRKGLVTVAVNGKIYAIGGGTQSWQALSTVEEYDPKTDKWEKTENMPSPRYHFQATALNGKIYVIGGWDTGDSAVLAVEVFDPEIGEWERLKDMPFHIGTGFACAGEGKIYLVGGVGETNGLVEFEPQGQKWTSLARMPTFRFALSGAMVDGKIHAIGGMDWGLNTLSTVEIYDILKDEWIPGKEMPSRRSHFGNSCVVDGKIYIIGGTPDWPIGLSTNEQYTPEGWRRISVSPAKKETSTWGWIRQNAE